MNGQDVMTSEAAVVEVCRHYVAVRTDGDDDVDDDSNCSL